LSEAAHSDGGRRVSDLRGARMDRLTRLDAPRRLNRRYSAFVRRMRVLLPVTALLLIVLAIAWPLLREQVERIRIGDGTLTADEIGNLRMVNPRYSGTTDDDRAFEIRASVATQDSPDDPLLRLENLEADLEMSNGAWLLGGAPRGLYDRDSRTIELSGGVNLFHDEGYELTTESLFVDMENEQIFSTDPVHVQGPIGEIDAEGGFEVHDDGDRVIFQGPVRMLIRKDEESS
jgi:lipopolysaccharide export system protein LptC